MFNILNMILLGIAIAAPIGPVSMLYIQKVLIGGFKTGFLSGTGIATAHAVFATLAIFGITTLNDFSTPMKSFISLIASCYLIYISTKSIISQKQLTLDIHFKVEKNYYLLKFLSITLANPMTIISFISYCSSSAYFQVNHNLIFKLFCVSGIFLGSLFWWLGFATLTLWLRKKIDNHFLSRLNIVFSIITICLGIKSIISINL